MKKLMLIIIPLFLFVPALNFAAWTDLNGAVTESRDTIILIGRLLMSLSVVVFFWGIVKFIWQDKKEEGKTHMIWGILGLFVLFTIWGIISFLQKSVVDNNGTQVELPTIEII